MNWNQAKTYGRLASRIFGTLAVVAGVVALGFQGWQWQSTVTVNKITVTNARHAPTDTVRHLARVDSGTVMQTIDEALVADRVARHPWVKSAEITKQRAQRTLKISVHERTPTALVMSSAGNPAYYLDEYGYAMPRPDSANYEVPLVRGLDEDYHPMRQVGPSNLQTVLRALPNSGVERLLAEIIVADDGTLRLMTRPIGPHGSLPVLLGSTALETRLRRFGAFAEQVLTTDTERSVAEIDLRFDNQIVTRKHPMDESPS